MRQKNNIKNFYLINLGCRVNIFEINSVANDLISINLQQTNDINLADIVIINTCSVTNAADVKSKNKINQAINAKLKPIVIVMGCFSQVNKEYFNNLNVHIVIGNKYKNNIKQLLQQYLIDHKKNILIENLLIEKTFDNQSSFYFEDNTRAFIKIQDGCNYMCSYCIIPFSRGKQRSKNHFLILEEIKKLVNNNYHEIVLTGVNVAGYGEDNEYKFIDLLKEINLLSGNFRVRISSVEPFQISHEIIDLICNNRNRWCQHLHICLQSASDKILQEMNRKYSWQQFCELTNYIFSKNSLFAISTDYIVGFCSETKQDFIDGLNNLKNINFSSMHIFPYSVRKFTKASLVKNIVSSQEKKNRFNEIKKIKEISENKFITKFINKEVDVLFEDNFLNNTISGHCSEFFIVKVNCKIDLKNKMRKVMITSVKDNIAFGKLI